MAAAKKALVIDPKVGDELFIPGSKYRADRKVIVVSVARVRFEVVDIEKYERYQEKVQNGAATHWDTTTWRKDTGQEDGAYSYNAPKLYTPERWARKLREDLAREYLKKIRIDVWNMDRDVIDPLTLTNLIRKHNGEEEI